MSKTILPSIKNKKEDSCSNKEEEEGKSEFSPKNSNYLSVTRILFLSIDRTLTDPFWIKNTSVASDPES